MSDNRKLFHFDKAALINECIKRGDRIKELEARNRELEEAIKDHRKSTICLFGNNSLDDKKLWAVLDNK